MKTREIIIAGVLVLISVGFSFLIFASGDHANTNWIIFLIIGAIAVFAGICILVPAYKYIEKEEKKRELQRHEEFIKALKDLPNAIKDAIIK